MLSSVWIGQTSANAFTAVGTLIGTLHVVLLGYMLDLPNLHTAKCTLYVSLEKLACSQAALHAMCRPGFLEHFKGSQLTWSS